MPPTGGASCPSHKLLVSDWGDQGESRLRFITLAYLGLAGEKGMASASRRRAITLPFS